MKRSLPLLIALSSLVVLGIAGCSFATSSGDQTSGGSGSGGETTSSNGSSAETSGALTVGTTEGPYYVTGTALLKEGNLNEAELPGDAVRIVGRVHGGAGAVNPVPGAKIEIWQADSAGSYHPNSNGDASQYGPSELALRGYVLSAGDGSYSFDTIYPGQYPGRTRHIHVRISAPGYGAVATQLIVPAKSGDAMTPANDSIALSLPEVNHVVFDDVAGVPTATFDVHLGAD